MQNRGAPAVPGKHRRPGPRRARWRARVFAVSAIIFSAINLSAILAAEGAGVPQAAESARELVVFQAASLKTVFASLAARFEKEHPGVKVVSNAAGSQELRTQIEHGGAADVFASADRKHMDLLVRQGLVGPSSVFACNEPVLVVWPGVASSIKTFADLPRVDRLVIGTPEVPIGAYTLQILEKAGAKYGAAFSSSVQTKVASRELNVRQVLAKVALGEADAGVVYRSDAASARGKVKVLEIPPEVNVTAEYPIAALKAAPHPELARAWISLVKSAAGTAALGDAGFTPCPNP